MVDNAVPFKWTAMTIYSRSVEFESDNPAATDFLSLANFNDLVSHVCVLVFLVLG